MTIRSTFNCFGLVLHGYAWDEIRNKLNAHTSQNPFWIVTANAEILLYAKQSPWYWELLRQADLRLIDGSGPQFLGYASGARPVRLPGVQLSELLIQHAAEKEWGVAIVGGREGIGDKAAWTMRERYPDIKIRSVALGDVSLDGNEDGGNRDPIFEEIILVALGHPKQEAWISKNQERLRNAKIVVGIGGTADYWAGKVPRAPKLFQILGLEWLWRLTTQPQRWKRIYRAVVSFPLAVLKDKMEGN